MTTISNEAEFFRFMELNGPSSDGGKRNYLSWLRYVNSQYHVNFDNLDLNNIENIIQDLRITSTTREKYTSSSAISDIRSALNKYLAFLSSNNQAPSIADDIFDITGINSTSVKREVESRLGQGKYRQELIKIWGKCAVTEFERVDLLISSHIKPWLKSTDIERLDPFNGLLLSPSLDKLFDRGYISFTDEGNIIISSLMDEEDITKIGLNKTMKLYKVEPNCIPYLKYHRTEVFVNLS